MIDTHCHLNFVPLLDSLDAILSRAISGGVKNFIVPGTGIETSNSAIFLSNKYAEKGVYSAVGIHPEELLSYEESILRRDIISDLDKITDAIITNSNQVVAVGEVGLDYYYLKDLEAKKRNEAIDLQQRVFALLLKVALKNKKPVIVHAREAFDDVFRLVRDSGVGRVVQHCFVGSMGEANRWLDIGGYISLTGIITYKKNLALREVVSKIPLERIMLETDAPYLSPEGYRKLVCEPLFITETAKCLGEIKGIPYEVVDEITSENARQFFGIN